MISINFKKKMMKVHVVRSEEVSKSLVKNVSELVGKLKEPINFIFLKEDIEEEPENMADERNDMPAGNGNFEPEVLSWKELFEKCDNYRRRKQLNDDEVVVLLTDHNNELNWFSSWDESGDLNFFIQTSGWGDLIDAESCYPVVYELATIPLIIATCGNLKEAVAMSHEEPRGCPFDMCRDKRQVQIRLRTGDICSGCLGKMKDKGVEYTLARQVFSILEEIRSQIVFRNRFGITGESPKVNIDTGKQELLFSDQSGEVKIHLDNRQITVCMFFLNHPEGVMYKDMPDHRTEIKDIYKTFCSDANQIKFDNTVEAIVDTVHNNTLSEVISTINNKKLIYYLGKAAAKEFIIEGKRNELHLIRVPRQHVLINGEPFDPRWYLRFRRQALQ